MYLSGDTVDFQLGTDPTAAKDRAQAVLGDLRISIGNYQAQMPTAVIYHRKVSAEREKADELSIRHRCGRLLRCSTFAPLANAKINVRVIAGKQYVIEALMNPLEDPRFVANGGSASPRRPFGVTYGDPAGQRTRLRSYWSNQHTGIVDDAVFELVLEPRYWAEIVFSR